MKQTVKKSDVIKLIQSELRTFNKINGKNNKLNEKFLGIGYPASVGVVGQSGRAPVKKVYAKDTLPKAKRANTSAKSLKEGRMSQSEMADILVEYLGIETAWDEMVQAMSQKEMEENFEWIAGNHDIEY